MPIDLPVRPWRRTPTLACKVCGDRATRWVQAGHMELQLSESTESCRTYVADELGAQLPVCAAHFETEAARLSEEYGICRLGRGLREQWRTWAHYALVPIWFREWQWHRAEAKQLNELRAGFTDQDRTDLMARLGWEPEVG